MSDDPIAARLAMLRRVGGDKLIGELIDLLLQSVPHKLQAARAALTAGDRATVSRLAHGLGSGVGNLGLADMQQAALDVEHCADHGPGDLDELLRRLEASWEQGRDQLVQIQRGFSS
jgi:HPt (histidine-containing phosphotransfer) domain-containing protein